MLTLKEFSAMSDDEKCNLVNKQLEEHSSKNFKRGEIGFTFTQAEKVLSECGIYRIGGIFRTSEQALDFLEKKKKESEKKILTPDQIERIIELVSDESYDKLKRLCASYNFVASYIIEEDRSVKIKPGAGQIQSTTIRVYEDTWKQWREFTSDRKNIGSGLNLLNTALLEFMERHK